MAVLAPDGVIDESPARDDRIHRLVTGTELLGEYQGTGYQTPRFLVRRRDGQLMQLPLLLYRVATALDGRGADEIARDLSAQLGRELTGEQVSFLVDERLRPVGIIAPEQAREQVPGAVDGGLDQPPAQVRADPLLALRYRVGVVPASVSWRIAGIFRPFFHRPVWMVLLAAFVTTDVLVVLRGGLTTQLVGGFGQMVQRPVVNLLILGLVMVALAFHECGHVAACRYGGARPGNMGIGLYLVWPAFYSTVTDSYRLGRIGRLRTDLGGVYFNVVFIAGTALAYLGTGQPWLLIALLLLHVETAWQFLPSIRFDGYYMLSDLVGVPELFSFVRPVLVSALPGRRADPRVHDLRRWSRRVIVLWVAVSVPLLLGYLVVLLLVLPRALPVMWQEILRYWSSVHAALRAGDTVTLVLGVFQAFILVLPWVGTVLLAVTFARQLGRGVSRRCGWTRGAPRPWRLLRGWTAGAVVLAVTCALVRRVAVVASAGTEPGDGAPLVRAQVRGFAGLLAAVGTPRSEPAAARQLAVVAAAVLAVCFLTTCAALGARYWTFVLPLAAVAAMGPAVSVLATFGPGLLGAAWAAVGVTFVALAARRPRGRHHRGRNGLPLAVLGGLALLLAVATEPLLSVPLAVCGALLTLRLPAAPDTARPGATALAWTTIGFAGIAGVTAVPDLRIPAAGPLDPGQARVLLLVAGLLVAGGLLQARLRVVAVGTLSIGSVATLPLPGAPDAFPLLVCAGAALGALVVQAWTRRPVVARPHPLLRALLAVPVLALVVVGALYAPSPAGTPQLAAPPTTARVTGGASPSPTG